MSTPNEPDSSAPDNAGAPADGSGRRASGVEDVPRAGSGTGPGGMPPWQRVGNQRPPTGGPVQPNQGVPPSQNGGAGHPIQPGQAQPPAASDQRGAGLSTPIPGSAPQGRSNGAPKRPLVTGTAVNRPPVSATTRVPIAKLDSEGNPAQDPAKGRNSLTGKVIDGPTRNIGRNDIAEELPDLDAIHHPTSAPLTGESGVSSTRPVESYSAGPRGPLRAVVQLRRIDPWSTFKISSVLAIALFLIWMIAIGVLYVILDGMGVWDQLNGSFGDLVSSDSTTDTAFQITAGTVFGIAALVGAVYVIVFTALTTVGAFIYNMSADLVGGVEVTLADRD